MTRKMNESQKFFNGGSNKMATTHLNCKGTNYKEIFNMNRHMKFLFVTILMVTLTTTSMAQGISLNSIGKGTVTNGVRLNQINGLVTGYIADKISSPSKAITTVDGDTVAEMATGVTASTIYTVSGGSAATIMTGMVGAPVVAGAGGFGAAHTINKYVFNGDSKADEAGRTGTYVGATVGTAASVGTLAVVGAGPTGLATIGGVVGGGMAAGAITVLAAPAACAAVVGGAFYWLFGD